MTLHIETEEVDRLAQELVELTGETVDVAVAKALRQRVEQERRLAAFDRGARLPLADRDAMDPKIPLAERIKPLQDYFKAHFDTSPITKEEWDAACGDDL